MVFHAYKNLKIYFRAYDTSEAGVFVDVYDKTYVFVNANFWVLNYNGEEAEKRSNWIFRFLS